MRIVLLNSSFISPLQDYVQRTNTAIRAGIASIAGALRADGHDVTILDPTLHRLDAGAVAKAVADARAECAGLPAYTEELYDAAEIARAIKRVAPGVRTILGGYHVSALPRETLAEFPSFDIGIVGEGEPAFRAIAAGTPLDDVSGLVFRIGSGDVAVTPPRADLTEWEDLPMPAWDLYDLDRYRSYPLPVELLRSCPFTCPYCFKATGHRVRYKPPERALAEIEHLITRYGVEKFFFVSSGTFPLNREHALAICNGIIDRGWPIRWHTGTRVDQLDRELLVAMKRSGCYLVNLGIESGDPQILEQSGKGINLDRAEEIVRICWEIGLETEINFILGLPYETRASLENTRRFARRLRPYATLANFAILTPFPGTAVYGMALRHEGGLEIRSTDWRQYTKHTGTVLAHAGFAEGELRRYQSRLYLSYYLGSPRKILRLLTSAAARELMDPWRALALLKSLFGV